MAREHGAGPQWVRRQRQRTKAVCLQDALPMLAAVRGLQHGEGTERDAQPGRAGVRGIGHQLKAIVGRRLLAALLPTRAPVVADEDRPNVVVLTDLSDRYGI